MGMEIGKFHIIGDPKKVKAMLAAELELLKSLQEKSDQQTPPPKPEEKSK